MTEEQLKKIAEVQDFLEQVAPPDDPYLLTERLSWINAYMAWTGTMLGVATKELMDAKKAVQIEHFSQLSKMPATVQKDFVDNMCAEQNARLKQIDRLNAACTHQGENIRTQISFIKEQIKLECSSTPVRNN